MAFQRTDKHILPVKRKAPNHTQTHTDTLVYINISAFPRPASSFCAISRHTHKHTSVHTLCHDTQTHTLPKQSSSFHVRLLSSQRHKNEKKGTRSACEKEKKQKKQNQKTSSRTSTLMYFGNNYTMRREDVPICDFQVEEVRR